MGPPSLAPAGLRDPKKVPLIPRGGLGTLSRSSQQHFVPVSEGPSPRGARPWAVPRAGDAFLGFFVSLDVTSAKIIGVPGVLC